MAVRPIPEGSVEIQSGLWAHLRTFAIAGVTYNKYSLYSADGYCFWHTGTPENYDENGSIVPMEDRIFYQYASTAYGTIDDLNANFFSVPIEDGINL